jgi:hypothetical protein
VVLGFCAHQCMCWEETWVSIWVVLSGHAKGIESNVGAAPTATHSEDSKLHSGLQTVTGRSEPDLLRSTLVHTTQYNPLLYLLRPTICLSQIYTRVPRRRGKGPTVHADFKHLSTATQHRHSPPLCIAVCLESDQCRRSLPVRFIDKSSAWEDDKMC